MNLLGRTAIVVGGTSGIGQALALKLARDQANVTIIGRNAEMGEKIVSNMKELCSNGQFHFVSCDASLMSEISKCCSQLKKLHPTIHYLILSQGIASVKGYDPTSENIDRKLALHYYGRMMFIKGLLPVLTHTADALLQSKQTSDENNNEDSNEDTDRVTVLSIFSGGIHSPAIFHDDLDLKNNFTLSNAANVAGFYNDLGLDKLAITNPKITFIHSCPGFVNTNWGSDFPWILKAPVNALQSIFAMTPEQCAEITWNGLLNANRNHQEYHKKHRCHFTKKSNTTTTTTTPTSTSEEGEGEEHINHVKIMSEKGEISYKVTKMHNDSTMEEVWNHTNEILSKYED